MIKKLLIVLIAVFTFQAYSQETIASPYSFYGIGIVKFKGTVENRSMGGLSIFTDSIHVNLRNPASYVSPDLKIYNEESRPIKFAVGASYNKLNLKSESASAKVSTTSFDYFAMSIPLKKFGFGFGILPVTAVGYKLEAQNSDGLTSDRYKGEGGVNKAFVGLGYKITDKLSIGVDVNYNFGNIKNSSIAFIYDSNNELVQFQSIENNRSDLSGFNFNLGLSYKTMLNEKYQITSGLTYAPKSYLTSENARSFSSLVVNEVTGQEFVTNTIVADLESQNLKTTELQLPSRISFGAGIGQPNRWFLGAEYSFQNTSKFSNPIFDVTNAKFVNASTIALGGFFIPEYDSFSKYWKRVVYRAGLHFDNTGLEIDNETINEFGMSFGLGLPLGGLFSNANIGLELGKRGTTKQNLIQENFVNLQFSLSLNQRWFEKTKYD